MNIIIFFLEIIENAGFPDREDMKIPKNEQKYWLNNIYLKSTFLYKGRKGVPKTAKIFLRKFADNSPYYILVEHGKCDALYHIYIHKNSWISSRYQWEWGECAKLKGNDPRFPDISGRFGPMRKGIENFFNKINDKIILFTDEKKWYLFFIWICKKSPFLKFDIPNEMIFYITKLMKK